MTRFVAMASAAMLALGAGGGCRGGMAVGPDGSVAGASGDGGGVTCAGGRCAVTLASAPDLGIFRILPDDTEVFFYDGGLWKVSVEGGTPFRVRGFIAGDSNGFGLDETAVYFTDELATTSTPYLWKMGLGGGDAHPVRGFKNCNPVCTSASDYPPHHLMANGSRLYWLAVYSNGGAGMGAVMAASLSGSAVTPTPVTSFPLKPTASASTHLVAVAADDKNVYWMEEEVPVQVDPANLKVQGTLWTAPLPSGSATMLAQDGSALGVIAVGSDSVYWANSYQGTIMKIAKSGGTPTMVASNQDYPVAVAVDSKSVYWTDAGAGTVMKAPKAGGKPVTLIAHRVDPQYIAVDATSVYWTECDGQLPNQPPQCRLMKLTPK